MAKVQSEAAEDHKNHWQAAEDKGIDCPMVEAVIAQYSLGRTARHSPLLWTIQSRLKQFPCPIAGLNIAWNQDEYFRRDAAKLAGIGHQALGTACNIRQ